MESTAYRDRILSAYRGELVAESVYRELANRSTVDDQKLKLRAIADIEGHTAGRLEPIAERLGIQVSDAERLRVAERRVSELESLSWPDFIEKALRDWPPYIARFEAVKRLAPAGDLVRIQWLVDHEVALVAFAQIEHEAMGSHESYDKLHAFLDAIHCSHAKDGTVLP
jgi:hypothetical protein